MIIETVINFHLINMLYKENEFENRSIEKLQFNFSCSLRYFITAIELFEDWPSTVAYLRGEGIAGSFYFPNPFFSMILFTIIWILGKNLVNFHISNKQKNKKASEFFPLPEYGRDKFRCAGKIIFDLHSRRNAKCHGECVTKQNKKTTTTTTTAMCCHQR